MVTSASLVISVLAPLLLGEMRTFSAADGDQTFEAELVSYDPTTEKVTVKRKGERKPIIFDASRISEEDRTYVQQAQTAKNTGRAISMRIDKEVSGVEIMEHIPKNLDVYTYKGDWHSNEPHETHRRTVTYSVTLTNKSNFAIGPFDLHLKNFMKEGALNFDGVANIPEVTTPRLIHKDDEDIVLTTHQLTVPKLEPKAQIKVGFEPVEYLKYRFKEVSDSYMRVGDPTPLPRPVTRAKTVTDNFVGSQVALVINDHEAKVAYEGDRSQVKKLLEAGLTTSRAFPSDPGYDDPRAGRRQRPN